MYFVNSQSTSGSNQIQSTNQIHREKRARHVTTTKMFAAISLLFVLSYAPVLMVIVNVSNNFHILYVYLINHVGNPIIYFVVNEHFRKDVKKIWAKIWK